MAFTERALAQLSALRGALGREPLTKLRTRADALEQVRAWCRQSLASQHLVHVASALSQQLGAELADLETLGIPVDVLACFPAWRTASRRGFRPQGLGLSLAPAGAGESLRSLRIQLSPAAGTVSHALLLLRDLLRCTDPDVQLVVVVEPGANLDGLRALVADLIPVQQRRRAEDASGSRVRFVELPTRTVFAQDNARSARDAAGNPVLLVPRAFQPGASRADDELSPRVAEAALGVRTVGSMLFWEGGNLISDSEHCFVGVDTIADNVSRLGLGAAEVLAILSAELGAPVAPLGELSRARSDGTRIVSSGQASFHIDLDVALLGRYGRRNQPVALVADAARGLDFVERVLEREHLFRDHFVPPAVARTMIAGLYDAYARERHEQLLAYAGTLDGLGYKIVGVPDLRVDPAENVFGTINLDFGYCNVLAGLRRGRPAAYYLRWGIPALDSAAESRLRSIGLEAVSVATSRRTANALMSLQGGLHCFCGPLG